jgi:hypothetical protein
MFQIISCNLDGPYCMRPSAIDSFHGFSSLKYLLKKTLKCQWIVGISEQFRGNEHPSASGFSSPIGMTGTCPASPALQDGAKGHNIK